MTDTMIRNDQITGDDLYNYTHGACWVLANAISKKTGWQRCSTAPERHHVFVRTPAGDYLDVEGRHTEDYLVNYYSMPWEPTEGIEDIADDDDLEDDYWRFGWDQEYRDRADELVPLLIKEYAPEYELAA